MKEYTEVDSQVSEYKIKINTLQKEIEKIERNQLSEIKLD